MIIAVIANHQRKPTGVDRLDRKQNAQNHKPKSHDDTPAVDTHQGGLVVAAQILDHQPVIGQRPRRHQFDLTPEFQGRQHTGFIQCRI